jgi:hypothetical protein
MSGNPRFHRRGHAQGAMNPGKVVVHEIEASGVAQVLDLLAEAVGHSLEMGYHPALW